MHQHSLMLVDPPRLSDETASEMREFLYELINAFENQYRNQLQRHYERNQPQRPNPFEDLDDDSPPF